jgi:predicted ArsR family transcriptional regulator
VKKAVTLNASVAGTEPVRTADGRTRDRVIKLLLERGSATVAELGQALGVSPAGIRRHLDAMLTDGMVTTRIRPVRGHRGRGRPARVFTLTEAARLSCAPHTYDDLAGAALRWIARRGGSRAVADFAAEQVSGLEERCRAAMEGARDEPLARARALARALSAEGYAASATTIATGGQLCQHNCPVAHVAAEFPQLCEAETKVISRLVGTHVQRLATIANGDGVCTTHIPNLPQSPPDTGVHADRDGLARPADDIPVSSQRPRRSLQEGPSPDNPTDSAR